MIFQDLRNMVFRAVAAVNRNGIKILLANSLSTFPIKDNPVLSKGPKSLPIFLLFYFMQMSFW